MCWCPSGCSSTRGGLLADEKPWDELAIVTQQEWEPGDSDWPIAGDRRDDTDLLRTAAKAWYTRASGPTGLIVHASAPAHWWPDWSSYSPEVGVLFAGDVDGATVVLMYTERTDTSVGRTGLLARYEPGGDRHENPRLFVTSVERPFERGMLLPLTADYRPDDPLGRGEIPGPEEPEPGTRFLAPPNLTKLGALPVGEHPTDWRGVGVSDRVTDRVPVRGPDELATKGCGVPGLLLRGTYTGEESKSTQYFLYRRPEDWYTPTYPVEIDYSSMNQETERRDPGAELGDVRIRSLLQSLGCERGSDRRRQLSRVSLTEVWHGELPESGGGASMVVLYREYLNTPETYPSLETGLLVSDEPEIDRRYGDHDPVGDSEEDDPPRSTLIGKASMDQVLMATWWEASIAGTNRWYLLISGDGGRIDHITVAGGLEHEIDGHAGIVRGPRTDNADELPTVRITARGEPGDDGSAAHYSVVLS